MDLAFIPFIPKDYFHWSSCAKFVGILSVFSSANLDCFEFTRLRFLPGERVRNWRSKWSFDLFCALVRWLLSISSLSFVLMMWHVWWGYWAQWMLTSPPHPCYIVLLQIRWVGRWFQAKLHDRFIVMMIMTDHPRKGTLIVPGREVGHFRASCFSLDRSSLASVNPSPFDRLSYFLLHYSPKYVHPNRPLQWVK